MHHIKAFDMINLQYKIKVWKKNLNKATVDKNLHPPPLFSTLRLFESNVSLVMEFYFGRSKLVRIFLNNAIQRFFFSWEILSKL